MRHLFGKQFLLNNFKLGVPGVTTSLGIHATACRQADKIDDSEYQQDLSSGIKNLESLGLAKPYWSWPQYNRIIYPPTEDGKPLKNPVSLSNQLKFQL